MTEIRAELDEKEKYIELRFDFDWRLVEAVRKISGHKFFPPEKGGPFWRVPRTMDVGKDLRQVFGDELVLGPRLKVWGSKEAKHRNDLLSLAGKMDHDLEILPSKLPHMYDFISNRPYQKADIGFMAAGLQSRQKSTMNCNEPGTGKTVETIASIFEAGIDEGFHLVMAPVSSLDVVWEFELLRFDQPHWVLVVQGGREERMAYLEEAMDFYEKGEPFWLVINPAMVQYRRKRKRGPSSVAEEKDEDLVPSFPILHDINWTTVIIDEFHKCGLGNTQTLTHKAVRSLKAEHKITISGTPIQGKPIKIFGPLQFMHPEEFTSKWNFADQWLYVTENEYGKTIGKVRPDREERFNEMLSQYMVRRTKAEVAPQLPPKQYVEIWATMDDTKQDKQYKQFALEAEIRIDDEKLSATSILAEYTRLKQFAIAEQTLLGYKDGKPILRPTTNSCKLPHLVRILEERGIAGDPDDSDEQVVVFSQFEHVVTMVTAHLQDLGIRAEKFTGKTKAGDRTNIVREFQRGEGAQVLVMTTTAGGVAITLDRASTVVFMDETWTPDDQEQAEDRVHRVSKIHQVTIYYIRTKGTIEHYIENLVDDKREVNARILDLRRQGLRAI